MHDRLVSRRIDVLHQMMFSCLISELMLPTLIQRYDKIISCLIQFENEGLTEILQTVRCIYQFVKPFLNKKMSIFDGYGALNNSMPDGMPIRYA